MPRADIQRFKTDKESLFNSALEIISNAGYIISATEDAARRIVYIAEFGNNFFRYQVTVSITSIASVDGESASAVNINAAHISNPDNQFALLSDFQHPGNETKLIEYLTSELAKKFTLLPKPANSGESNAPGAANSSGGCLVMMGVLGSLATGCGFGGYMLLTNLFS